MKTLIKSSKGISGPTLYLLHNSIKIAPENAVDFQEYYSGQKLNTALLEVNWIPVLIPCNIL
jgi:hypothetical protein